METRKLYYEDCHLAPFTARVLRCQEGTDGFRVLLDATAFYPEGGGLKICGRYGRGTDWRRDRI